MDVFTGATLGAIFFVMGGLNGRGTAFGTNAAPHA